MRGRCAACSRRRRYNTTTVPGHVGEVPQVGPRGQFDPSVVQRQHRELLRAEPYHVLPLGVGPRDGVDRLQYPLRVVPLRTVQTHIRSGDGCEGGVCEEMVLCKW